MFDPTQDTGTRIRLFEIIYLGKDANCQHAPDITDTMDQEGAAGIIKMILLVQDLHAKEDNKARHTANKD